MAYTPIVDQVAIASTAIALLERDTMLASTVWRDPVPPETFARKKDDTVSIFLPAYAVANKRTLRANQARQRKTLHERKVDISLTNDLQIDVPLTDENLTLDIPNLVRSVIAPCVGGIVRGYEEEIAALMEAADYEVELTWDESNPYGTLVDARVALDAAAVPANDRFLVVGSNRAAQLLKDELLVQANKSGSTQTLRQGEIGMVASFTVLTSAFLAPDSAFAYHRTAYALCSRAPIVPDGVAWGNVQSAGGFSIRVMQHLSDTGNDLQNVVYHDSWFGAEVVKDAGHFDGNGKFIPAEDPTGGGETPKLVRSVSLGTTASS